MTIISIASYLVSPGKNVTPLPEIQGKMLDLSGKLYRMLSALYEKAENECNIPIRFVMDSQGNQTNETRRLIIEFINLPNINNGKALAERLSTFTNNISGLGLLFLIYGEEANNHKIVISRFHAEEGVLADIHGQGLEIEFIERIFMKNSLAYKAAYYFNSSLSTGFWDGFVVDKQLNYMGHGIAQYWIYDFLSSDLKLHPKWVLVGSRWLYEKHQEKQQIRVYVTK